MFANKVYVPLTVDLFYDVKVEIYKFESLIYGLDFHDMMATMLVNRVIHTDCFMGGGLMFGPIVIEILLQRIMSSPPPHANQGQSILKPNKGSDLIIINLMFAF